MTQHQADRYMHHSTEKGTQMSNQSHVIGSPLQRLGVAGPVSLRAFPGIGALLRISRALALVLGVLAVLALSTTSAKAAIAHKYISQFTGAPAGSFSDGAVVSRSIRRPRTCMSSTLARTRSISSNLRAPAPIPISPRSAV